MKKQQVKVAVLLTLNSKELHFTRDKTGTGRGETESRGPKPRGVSEVCNTSSKHLASKEESIYSTETEIRENVQCQKGEPDNQQ